MDLMGGMNLGNPSPQPMAQNNNMMDIFGGGMA